MNTINIKKLNNNLYYFKHYNYKQIYVYGINAIDILNSISIRDINNIDKAFYTFLVKNNFKKTIFGEAIIIKYSSIKYLILTESIKLYNYLKKLAKKFKHTSVYKINFYDIYSIHGAINNFSIKNHTYIVSRQGYTHIIYLEKKTFKTNYLQNLNELTIDNYKFFLYNNNVICKFNIKPKRLLFNLLYSLYSADNILVKVRPIFLSVIKYHSSLNFLPIKKAPIYNMNNKKIGYVLHSFYLKNKLYPFITSIVYKYKFSKNVYVIDKYTKKQIILKYQKNY